ncbi:E3 SUMO-protein ligase ZBED1-like [Lampris incognitus]|uniref:E3 SUMO-protein ligase ZBED1-like n=1 Tax=Lampris incognitus TaxID=2546036 RepID=UPI0024B532AE|nr:E3 SUMO-protein ligase ZBED1-like [Lampris incognitus]
MAASKDELVPKKGTVSSVVWNWFGFVACHSEQTTTYCKVCSKAVATKGSSTTNVFQHLKQRHAAEWEKCYSLRDSQDRSPQTPTKKQSTLGDSFSHCVPYDKKGTRWKTLTDAVALHMAKDMVPIYTVEKPGFIHMLKTFNPKYVLPSRKYFAGVALPHLYNCTQEKIARELQEVSFYSTTTDLWSSQTMQPYMSLTVHFINNWTLRSVCLQTAYFPEDHKSEIIAQGLKDALNSWNLAEDRLICMTTDSGTNIIKALKDEWPNLQCFGHRLHNTIDGVHDKKMIQRFLEQEKAIARVLGSDKKSWHLVPTWQDIDALESINKAVKPLQDFTDALSGEAYVSVSYIKPVRHLFKTSLLQPEEEDTELTETIKTNILRYLDDKYSNPVMDELLEMSSLVDPRFRTTYIDPGKVEQVKKRAVTELMSLPVPAEKSTPQQPGLAVQVCQEAQPPPNKKMTLASFFKKNVPLPSPHQPEAGKIETELATYLLTPEADPDTYPLQWWKRHEPNFPRLSNLAKKYLSIPATSALTERVFSVGGGIVTCNRACLKPEVVDRLVFLAKNL